MTEPRLSFLSRRRSLPMLYQAEGAECGLACLAMVGSFHGHHIDVNEIRHRFPVSLKGTTLRDLVDFARALGLSARAVRLEPASLHKLRTPAILHIDMTHFVVLKKMHGRDAIIHDPALGVRRLTPAQLDQRFTGIALEMTPTQAFERRDRQPRLSIGMLAGGAISGRGIWAKALLLSFSLQLLVLAAPLYVQLVVDQGITQGDREALLPLAAGFSLLLALRLALTFVRAQVLLAFGGFLGAALVSNVFRHMLRLPHSWFETRNVAALLSRLSSTQPIRELVAEGLVGVVVDGAMAVLTISIASFFAPALALLVLTGFLASAMLKWWQIRQSMSREQEYIETFTYAQQEFIETVRGIAAVKLFRKEGNRETRWGDRHVQSINAKYALDLVKAKSDIGRDGIQALILILIVYAGARQVISGGATLGVLMAFITYQQMFAASSAALLDAVGKFRLLDVHLHRLADVVLSEPEVEGVAAGDTVRPWRGALAVRDLEFRYGINEELIFGPISFDIAPGEFVAITGPSGGGKTTLLKLLVGLLEPTRGTVLYDGRPLSSLDIGMMREQIGAVMQDDFLLSGSLAQNISFFDANPDIGWVRECARMAAIDADIDRFPMGYNTLIGDMGTVLSGGQKQRVLLARALYKRPRILFMDEGTSNLDMDKEREVNANLASLDITRVVIAHRKDTIDAAGRILELTSAGLTEQAGRKHR